MIDDAGEVDRLLGIMAAANPAINRFLPIKKDLDGPFDSRSLRLAIDHGFRTVVWHHPGSD